MNESGQKFSLYWQVKDTGEFFEFSVNLVDELFIFITHPLIFHLIPGYTNYISIRGDFFNTSEKTFRNLFFSS